MRPINQTDIAPTLASALGVPLPNVDGIVIDDLIGQKYKNAILIIVDSLGHRLYQRLKPDMVNIPNIAASGFEFMANSSSTHTSPAIATILSGLTPSHHNIRNTNDAKASTILSLPEIASNHGVDSAVIMEKGGAEVYEGLINYIGAVPKCPNPLNFDRTICDLTLDAQKNSNRFIVTYFIGLDRAAHLGWDIEGMKRAALWIDEFIGQIRMAAHPGTLILICGDHAVHAGPLKDVDQGNFVEVIIGMTDTRNGT